MRILHFTPALEGGGIKTFICQLSNAQEQLGNELCICTIYRPKASAYAYKWLNKKVKTCDLGKINSGFSIKEVFTIWRFIQNGKYDVVNLHGFFYYYILAIWLLHHKTRFFYTVHSDAREENSPWDKRLFVLKRLFFRLGWIHPITISIASQKTFENLYHCHSTMIYNGVQMPILAKKKRILDQYKINEKTRVFVHVGRITKAKNQEMLCRVFDRLIKEQRNVVLLLVGQQQDNTIYHHLKLFFSDRIHYLGERDDAVQIMHEADALCLPSIWEGMPITILEALSVGCPTIASSVGGIPEMIDNGFNGLLSESISENEYYKCIVDFLNMTQPALEQMRAHCISTFEHFNIKQTAHKYIETYLS